MSDLIINPYSIAAADPLANAGNGAYCFYPMQETSGTTCEDSSGNGRDGTYLGGPTLNQTGPTTGMQSVIFDAVNDGINIGDMPGPTTFTIESWVYYSKSGSQVLFTDRGSSGFLRVFLTSTGDVNVNMYDIADYTFSGVLPGSAGWLHFALTYDAALTTAEMECFIDGVSQGTKNTGNPNGSTTDALIVCTRNSDSGPIAYGNANQLCYWGFWESVLSDAHIAEHAAFDYSSDA